MAQNRLKIGKDLQIGDILKLKDKGEAVFSGEKISTSCEIGVIIGDNRESSDKRVFPVIDFKDITIVLAEIENAESTG